MDYERYQRYKALCCILGRVALSFPEWRWYRVQLGLT